MKLSTDRILTTHVGSLPRPQPLVELLVKKDQEQPYDHAEFDRNVRQAVGDIVAHQVAIGIDVVSDGEASKIGYATYIKDRLTGFGGENFAPKPQRDLADYPDFRQRMIQFTGPQVFRRLCCIGDVRLSDHEAVKHDVANFKAAIEKSKPTDAFMPAAYPGVVSSASTSRLRP
jgi:5-methyltetrahydropteroyltriglutamate--homocysteine methyltransferase